MNPVRLAIVGTGEITRNAHLPAALRSPRVQLTALVDSDPERARALARDFSCDAMATARLEDAFPFVDGVLIATPNHTHAAIASQVLEKGIPVLIEKPLTTDFESARSICELAEAKNTFIATGYKTRHYRSVRLLKDLLDSGFLGAVQSFHYEFGSVGGWSPASGYNLSRSQTGGGVLVVTGTHFLSRMLHWFGIPQVVSFEDDSYGGPEANCKAVVRYRTALGNFEGTIQLSKTMPLANCFVMQTDRYRCELGEAETEVITLIPGDRPDLIMKVGAHREPGGMDFFQTQLEEFAECVQTGKPPLADGWHGAQCVKLVEDLYARRSQLPESWMWYGASESIVHV
jgi:predicted dehydrogenase